MYELTDLDNDTVIFKTADIMGKCNNVFGNLQSICVLVVYPTICV
jgi:hypothetical protein